MLTRCFSLYSASTQIQQHLVVIHKYMNTIPNAFFAAEFRLHVGFAILCLGLSSDVFAQSGGTLSASQTVIPVNTSNMVTIRLAIPANPKLLATSPNLQRWEPGGWVVLDRLYDDGTHGDTAPADNVFSLQTQINEPQTGTLTFRASTSYKGSLLRSFSNSLKLTIVPELSLQVTSGLSELFVIEGTSQNVVSTINLGNAGLGTVNVQNVVGVKPSDVVSLTTDYPGGGWNSSSSKSFVINQSFTGLAVGDCVVTNTSTVTGKGISVSDSILVHVIPTGGNPLILPVGASPDGVQVNVNTPVLFTATIANYTTPPGNLNLIYMDGGANPVVATLVDDGTQGDLTAGDGVYSGIAMVDAPSEGQIQFRATATFPGAIGERTSAPFSLIATSLQVGFAPSDMGKVVTDPASGAKMICNEVLVVFANPMTDAAVQAFAASFGATVVGTEPGMGMYQLLVPNPTCAIAPLLAAVTAMQNTPGVAMAAPNLIGSTDEVVPNDTKYAIQYAPQKIRADEAWVIARGGPVIAVLDSGVDYNHEDLAGRVIKGPDLVNGANEPLDDNGHGTHVAGIAAASGNNGKGVAGIAWNSKILAIKAADSAKTITLGNATASIKKAADMGAKIINCSWGFENKFLMGSVLWLGGLERAVNYASAKGAIVVCAAGNNGPGNPNGTKDGSIDYPARYANAFCVGSTTSSDGRSDFSSYGAEVDIAAPGSAIQSTLMGGGYGNMDGTSMAAPCVSGAIAVLWSRFPAYTAGQIKQRLQKTAVELPTLQLGAGRIDLFEAVFNGSFEDGMTGWQVTGTAGAVASLGPLNPTDRKKFGFASSGPDNAVVQTTLQQSFTIQPGVTQFKVAFDYNFVTEEYPEWVNRGYNDNMRILLVKPDGTTQQLAFEDVDHSSFTLVSGIDFPGGDSTVGQTGWKPVTATVPVTSGPGIYRIIVRDEGDGIYDSNVLIDTIRFKY